MNFNTFRTSFKSLFIELPSHEKELIYPLFEADNLGSDLRLEGDKITCVVSASNVGNCWGK